MGNDYQDDGEPGAGRVLLDFLTNNLMEKRVVFVVRKYGGIRMGADRFTCYERAGQTAIEKHTGQADWTTKADRKARRAAQQARYVTNDRGSNRGATNSVRGARPPSSRAPAPNYPNPTRGKYNAGNARGHRGHTYNYRYGYVSRMNPPKSQTQTS